MPTVITHAVLTLSAGTAFSQGHMRFRFWICAILCAVIPDADVIAFFFGISYGHFFGHRGFFHSIFFALILSVFLVGLLFRKEGGLLSPNGWRIVLFFFIVGASHGMLDAFTDGGLGIALLSPFKSQRYFFPWTPIPVSPIGLDAFLSPWGFRVMVSEIIYLWLPVFFICIGLYFVKRRFNYQKTTPPTENKVSEGSGSFDNNTFIPD